MGDNKLFISLVFIYSREWGLAALYCYRAYRERPFLDDAVSIWNGATVWMITDANAASGSHPLKSGTFSSSCNGSKLHSTSFKVANYTHSYVTGSVAGGVFRVIAAIFTNNRTDLTAQLVGF